MKGPFQRLRYHLRRVWECPRCHHKANTSGAVTTQLCDCQKSETGRHVSMHLVEDGPRLNSPRRTPPE